MACPRCGDVCHCYAALRTPNAGQLRPRFEVDSEDSSSASAVLVDPEQYDATEEQFSASLERPVASAPRFIPDQPAVEEQSETPVAEVGAPILGANPSSSISPACAEPNVSTQHASPASSSIVVSAPDAAPAIDAVRIAASAASSREAEPTATHASPSPDAWKEELAARLNSYRAKRKPRPPKYPSLALNFEPAFSPTSGSGARTPDLRTARVVEKDPGPKLSSDAPLQKVRVVPAEDLTPLSSTPPASGRLIEFPRLFGPAEPSPDQLAEPICEQPRILDAPEFELPAPALGGIVLESDDQAKSEERPGFEVPLRSASISRRISAAAVDGTVIIAAGVMFAYIFLQLVKVLPPVAHMLASAALIAGLLWAGYQYLLLTYSGSTPGLRLAKLQLAHFDGSPVLRPTRRWRVLTSLLSAVSLGLGFAWCFLDEDALCWHDRITRTHLVPRD